MQKSYLAAGTVGAFAVPVFEFMYGVGPAVISMMTALVFFIGMDWLSGWSASQKDGSYASHYGINGLFRTFFMLLLPAGGHLLDVVIGMPGILFGVFTIGLLYHTIKSMTANSVRAGWANWLPIAILERVTDWVQSEIESKLDRALKRKAERELE